MYFLASLQQNVKKYINIQKSNVHIADIMPKQEEDQIFQFVLTILSVKMKVKFPCKMVLQQAGRTLTSEAFSNQEGRFVFNQEVRLREQSEKMFIQINICLITEKGARYISGIAKLYHSQILRSEGQRVVITLSKCLDTQSFCEIRVEKIIREGPVRTRTLTIIPQGKQKYTSPRHNQEITQLPTDFKSPKKIQAHQMVFQSKSESHFPVTGNLRIGSRQNEQRYRDYALMSGHVNNLRKSNVSPKDRAKPINSKNKYQPLEFNGDFQRQKMLQAQVYKDNYQKLKQKYLKEVQTSKNELNKRIMLQNNQNNYKLEIVKLRLKTQELEKALVDKNVKLKQLAITLSTLQGRQSELSMLKEELANKQHAIDIMDDTIITLSKQNDELRFASKQNLYKLQQKIMILQNDLEMGETKSITKQQELERQIKNLHQILQNKQGQILRKTEMLQKEKKNVYELQRNLQNKLFQYDSQLQNQRNACKQKIDQTKLKIQEANQNSFKLNLQKSELSSQIDKLKGLLLKNQYQFKLYQQQINNLKSQIEELKPIRDKYNEMIKQLRSLSEQKIILERNHQKIIVSKETTLESLTMQYKKQIESLKKTIKQLEDKSKSLSTRFIQSDSQLQIAKNGLQKFKRNNENMSKQLNQLKQKQKQLKKSLKSKEQELQDTKKELFRFKQKNQSLFENTKNQVSKNRDELSRLKIQLQTQKSKSQQLAQTNSELNMQLARIKMTQQYTQEKYEKLLQSSKQKYAEYEQRIKEQQSQIAICFQKLKVQKANESDLIARLLKCDNQLSISKEKNQKLIKQLRILEQKNKQYDNALKSKQVELIQSLKRVSDLQQKIETMQQEKRQLKDQLQFNHNQLQKSKKIVEILQKDYQKAKVDIISYCQKLNERQKQLDDKIAESKREKENFTASETKYNSLKKDYQKFKDSISQALSASFAQAVQSFSNDKYEAVKTSNMNDTATTIYSFRRGIMDLNNDLITAINSAGKQNKTQIQKLNQKNRTLQRDIDLLKNEIERIQQSNRKQISEKDRQLSQLQQELRFIKTQKSNLEVEKQMSIEQLEEQINQYKSECQSLISAKDQLQFSLGSLRLQIDRLNEDYSKRIYLLANQKNELEQKLQYQCHNTQIAQKRVHELQIEIMNVNSVLILEKQQIYKKELRFAESEQEKQKIIIDLQFVKKQLKEAEERYTQLDIQYTTIKEIKEQYEIKLNEEENKLKQVRMFNKSILNQKEQIIKKELQKNLEVTQLENMIVSLRHSLQSEEQLKSKFKSDLQETTELTKKYINQVKDLQNVIHQQKNKYNQIIAKLREKEQILKDIKEENAGLKNRMEENLKRGKMTTDELDIQNNRLLKQLESLKIDSHQKICTLQSQLSKLNQQLSAYKDEVSELEQALFVQRENNNSMHENINRLKQQVQEIRNKLEEMQKAYEELAVENKEKDENMFEMGGKIYEYENRMREMEEERLKEIEELNNNLSLKYDEDYQEIYQKIQFIQKQKKYFQDKYHQKQVEVSKKNQELRHFEIEQLQFKKMYQEKIKKLEEQRLSISADKNKQIAKALEENKAQFESLRTKETQLRKIVHQLQISRNTIQKLQNKQKQVQTEKQAQIKVYQTEIENLRKKELTFKNFKDTVKSNQWSCQREVRKQIQTFIKKWLEGGQKQLRSETLIGSIKNLQQGLLGAISIIGKDLQ